MTRGLNKKQQAFAEEYARSYNATEAYQKVYGSLYSTANHNGPALAKDPRVIEYVKEIQKIDWEAKAITFERIADEISKIAFADGEKKVSNKDRLTALNLLQKQLGIEKTTISADVNQKVEITVGIEEDGD